MKLSIIIVNYNVKYFLEQCLDSVSHAVKNMDAEIFVVDNCSSDGSQEYLPPRFRDVVFIENSGNVGFSKANNQAIAQAQGEYILLLNPDTVIGENALTNICRFMDDNPQAGATGVKMIDGYGEFLWESKRGFPSPWNSFCKMSGLSRLFSQSKFFGGYHLRYLDENEIHKVDILAGAFMMLRREVLKKSGGFDERFFMYGEDIDLSCRINKAGYVNYYFPEPIIHYKGESTKKNVKYVKYFYEAMLIFFNKHYPHSNHLLKLLIWLAIVVCGMISALRKIIKCPKISLKRKSVNERTFNKQTISYEQLIREMDKHTGKKTLFRIYHPEKGIIIAANEIIVNKII